MSSCPSCAQLVLLPVEMFLLWNTFAILLCLVLNLFLYLTMLTEDREHADHLSCMPKTTGLYALVTLASRAGLRFSPWYFQSRLFTATFLAIVQLLIIWYVNAYYEAQWSEDELVGLRPMGNLLLPTEDLGGGDKTPAAPSKPAPSKPVSTGPTGKRNQAPAAPSKPVPSKPVSTGPTGKRNQAPAAPSKPVPSKPVSTGPTGHVNQAFEPGDDLGGGGHGRPPYNDYFGGPKHSGVDDDHGYRRSSGVGEVDDFGSWDEDDDDDESDSSHRLPHSLR
ncbi:uncharacterized protein LOC144173816 [Haemaphysalis longicornis]